MYKYPNSKYVNVNPKTVDKKLLQTETDIFAFYDSYQTYNKIGSGGFGRVYKGLDKVNNRNVILKYIQSNRIPNWAVIEDQCIPMEVLLLSKCQHIEGVVKMEKIYDFKSYWIIVMPELPNCIDLYDFIGEKVCLSEILACDILHQLIAILSQCHEVGVIHRDIKDENIIIDRSTRQIVLIDFGSGSIISDPLEEYSDFDGTRVYCPPEWITHQCYIGTLAESWTLGVLLFDMVCGDVPFTTDSKIIEAEIVFKRKKPSAHCEKLIRGLLNKNADSRLSHVEILNHPWMRLHCPTRYDAKMNVVRRLINGYYKPFDTQNHPIVIEAKKQLLNELDEGYYSWRSTTPSSDSSNSHLLKQKKPITGAYSSQIPL